MNEEDNVVPLNPSRRRRARPELPDQFGDWRDGLVFTAGENRRIRECIANGTTIIAHDEEWTDVLAYDDFKQDIILRRAPPWYDTDRDTTENLGLWKEGDTVRLGNWLTRKYNLVLPKAALWDVAVTCARRVHVHPPREWIDSLQWDGVARVDSWLTRYLGVQPLSNSNYVANVGRWFLVGACARLYKPGEKVDTCPVFEGPQGLHKSTAVRTLVPELDWYSDSGVDLNSKDRFIDIQGKWIIEVPEFESFDRGEFNRVKAYMSSATDSFRPPYERKSVQMRRSVVFVATANSDDYLRDITGNRRFYPLRCGTIDIDALRTDRDVLWAEAREMYRGGLPWWPTDRSSVRDCRVEQAGRVKVDPWQAKVTEWARGTINQLRRTITTEEVLGHCLDLKTADWDRSAEMRVGACLRSILNDDGSPWLERVQVREGKDRRWVYREATVTTLSSPDQEEVTR